MNKGLCMMLLLLGKEVMVGEGGLLVDTKPEKRSANPNCNPSQEGPRAAELTTPSH